MRFTSALLLLAHSFKASKGWDWAKSLKQAFRTIQLKAKKMLQQVSFFLGADVTADRLSKITGLSVEACQVAIDYRAATQLEVYTGSVYVPKGFTS